MYMCILGSHDPMSTHERTLYIDQSGVVGICLNRVPERQCWSCKCLYSGVNSPVGVLNVVHGPLHE